MWLMMVVRSNHASIHMPAACGDCGRADTPIEGDIEVLTPAGWQAICTSCESALYLPRVILDNPLMRLCALTDWLYLN